MTAAEKYAAKMTGSVMLPVAQIAATVKVPRSVELARAGLLPLRLTTIDPSKLDDDDMQDTLEKSDRAMKRLVCECSVEPRIVDRKPKDKNQLRYDDVHPDDIVALYTKIMELATSAYFEAEPATEHQAQLDSLTLIAIHARKWGLNPVDVGDMSPADFDALMMYSDLLDSALKNASE